VIKCSITLRLETGPAIRWSGLFASTCDAVIAVLEHFPQARRVSVRAV
jgi:hypothetical protein